MPRQREERSDYQERLEKTFLGIPGAGGPESRSWGQQRLISLNENFLLKKSEDAQRDVGPHLAWGHSMNFTIPWRLLGSRVYLLYRRVLEKAKFGQLPGVILPRVLGALSSIGHCFFLCANKCTYSCVLQSPFQTSDISKLCASLNCSSWTKKQFSMMGQLGILETEKISHWSQLVLGAGGLGHRIVWAFDNFLKRPQEMLVDIEKSPRCGRLEGQGGQEFLVVKEHL